jgi:hypothetical protein
MDYFGCSVSGAGDVDGDGFADVIVGAFGDNSGSARVFSGLATEPPTAVAGSDQPIHAGETILLDGSASFDNNTATADLIFAWSFSERPTGSTASLTGADTD